jgi:hypothetical protein
MLLIEVGIMTLKDYVSVKFRGFMTPSRELNCMYTSVDGNTNHITRQVQ